MIFTAYVKTAIQIARSAYDSLTDEQLSALKARIAEREKESAAGAPQADGEKETDEKKTDEEKTEE